MGSCEARSSRPLILCSCLCLQGVYFIMQLVLHFFLLHGINSLLAVWRFCFLCYLPNSVFQKFYFSCRFGESCRYIHGTQQQQHQQQPKSVVFGSNQLQNSNPFGFGVQKTSQSRGGTDFVSKQNQTKVVSLLISQTIH